jgi:hypothetical protein
MLMTDDSVNTNDVMKKSNQIKREQQAAAGLGKPAPGEKALKKENALRKKIAC